MLLVIMENSRPPTLVVVLSFSLTTSAPASVVSDLPRLIVCRPGVCVKAEDHRVHA
jgi:hypothetical protein